MIETRSIGVNDPNYCIPSSAPISLANSSDRQRSPVHCALRVPPGGPTMKSRESKIIFRADARHPCPVCTTGSKGCSATIDGLHFCRDEPADPDSWKCVKQGDEFNSYRRAKDRRQNRRRATKTSEPATPDTDWNLEAQKFAAELTPKLRAELRRVLHLPSVKSFDQLTIGWSGSAWTFPECDGAGRIIGILIRDRAGEKRMVKGSKRGLTIPARWRERPGPVLVVEGPTCTLAASSAGLSAVGRASNTGGVELLAQLFADLPTDRDIIICGENDGKEGGAWPGRDGAESLPAGSRLNWVGRSSWALPPERRERRSRLANVGSPRRNSVGGPGARVCASS